VLFKYILGGAILIPSTTYVEYMMPGIFAMAVVMGSVAVGVGLAEDLSSGVAERLRVLPTARSAFLTARSFTDVFKNLVVLPIVGIVGVLLGFKFHTTPLHFVVALALLLGLGVAFAWISMIIALATKSVEAAQGALFPLTLLASFASSGFAPAETMPTWLKHILTKSPVTRVDDAVRELITSTHAHATHNSISSLFWIVGMIAVTMPLAVRSYTRHVR
jgi:ABC transporter DrrB family efflux protein